MQFQNNIFLDKNLYKFYYKNDLNYIKFNFIHNTILAENIIIEDSMVYDEVFIFINHFFETMINNYPNADNLISYPGTLNPLIAKAHLENVKNYNFDYNIFYNKEKIYNKEDFVNNVLNAHCLLVNNFSCDAGECHGFAECSVCSSLRINTAVNSPIKYYKIDSEGYLIEELDEKPIDTTDNFLSAVHLSERFKIFRIKVTENKKLRFYKI